MHNSKICYSALWEDTREDSSFQLLTYYQLFHKFCKSKMQWFMFSLPLCMCFSSACFCLLTLAEAKWTVLCLRMEYHLSKKRLCLMSPVS